MTRPPADAVLLARLPVPKRAAATDPAAVVVRPAAGAPTGRLKAVVDAVAKATGERVAPAPEGGVPWNQRRQRVPTEAELKALFDPPAKK